MMLYFIGTIGNLLFGVKSLFQVIHCYRTKSTNGLSSLMLLFDLAGNLLCAIFIFGTTKFVLWPQFLNYSLATFFLIVLFCMKVVYRKKQGK